MEYWRTRIYQQTDEKFIPWFDGYWTQEWLSIKVGWYRLSDQGEQDPSAKRLASYLQEQYRARVLAPVALEIDPDSIMDQAAQFYLEQMGKQLAVIAQRYGVPADQLDRHINQIPAISLAPPADHSASLYQALHAAALTQLPAYRALNARIHLAGGANDGTSSAGINSVAQQTSEKLQSEFTGRGVAGAVATAVGRVAGAMISLGVAGFRAIVHEHEQPDTQVRIRKSLGEAFDKAWLKLVVGPQWWGDGHDPLPVSPDRRVSRDGGGAAGAGRAAGNRDSASLIEVMKAQHGLLYQVESPSTQMPSFGSRSLHAKKHPAPALANLSGFSGTHGALQFPPVVLRHP